MSEKVWYKTCGDCVHYNIGRYECEKWYPAEDKHKDEDRCKYWEHDDSLESAGGNQY